VRRITRVRNLTAAVFALGVAACAQTPGLLGWWRFDDGLSDVASDSSGRGNHGDVYSADWVRGPFGGALRFNGKGAHVSIPEIGELDGAEALTIEAWVYWEGVSRYPNIVTAGGWNPGGLLIFVADHHCSFRLGRPGERPWQPGTDWREANATLVGKIELGRWRHLTATFERPVMRTYLDGKPAGQCAWDFPVGANGDLLIGKWSDDVGHHGLIDEVKIYDRALSPQEVAASYGSSADKRTGAGGPAPPYELIPQTASAQPPAWALENELVRLEFDKRLRLTALIDKATGANRLARSSAWASLRTGQRNYRPSEFEFNAGRLAVKFGESGQSATFRVHVRPRWFVFEVESVSSDAVEQLAFVNLLAKPSQYVANMPGLAADDEFGICLRCLNLEARPHIGGRPPALRATCVQKYGLRGARAALAAAPMGQLRDVLKQVARTEGVPHSALGGPFALDAPLNRASYMFTAGLSTYNVDEWIEMAQAACIPFLHLSGWYTSQGHYEPRTDLFPHGVASLKAVLAKIHAAGLLAGMHTLTGCIQPRDPFVRPEPDPRLSTDRAFTLAADASADASAIELEESPEGLNVVWNYSSRGNVVRIGDELVQFRGIRTEPPYALTDCTRGAWGSVIQAHAKGAKAHHLYTRYTAFQPDERSTLVGEVADCIADKVNECGFDLIYHDGAEGMPDRQYGAARMRTAIYERIKRPIRVESSWSGLHHCWWFHSCVGAWDHPLWGLKRCIDVHCERNVVYEKLSLMPAQLGWWAIFGPRDIHDAEWPDEVEYLCVKALGHDMSMSFQTLAPASTPWNARQGEYLRMIGRYEKLRLSGYFADVVKEQLRTPRAEFRLTRADDGEWQFLPTDYLARKVVASDEAWRRWTVRNRFAAQPARLRVQALYATAPYDSADALTLADFSDAEAFASRRAAPGVEFDFAPSTAQVKVGETSARYAATNTGDERRGAWVRVTKAFSPDLNIGQCAALGVWVYGDGKGEVLNFQLRSPALYHGAYDEHIVTVDFQGWRYFELLLRERDAGVHYDHAWPYRSPMRIGRSPLDRRHVSELSIYYNNLPPGEQVECYVSPVKALPVVKASWANPRVTIGGQRIEFPVAMTSGEYIEFASPADCKLRDERGAVRDQVTPKGEPPILAAGDNAVEFGCDADPSPTPRARITIIPSGQPLRGVAEGKEKLKRTLRRLDDLNLALRPDGGLEFVRQDARTIRRLDGRDNAWTIVNEESRETPIARLELRVGRETPGREYDEGVPLDAFGDPTPWQAPANAGLVTGPRQAGMARQGVTATFAVTRRGARVGSSCATLEAASTLGDRSGWAAAARAFAPPLDLSAAPAIGLWLKGDGKGAFLKLQLRDADGKTQDYYTKLDFTTWRYVELTRPAMGEADRRRVTGLAFYLLSIPARGSAACQIDDVRALRAVPRREVVNPKITIGDATLSFPTTLRTGDSLVLTATGECRVVGREGAASNPPVRGALPSLRPGPNPVRFTCDGSLGNEVRLSVTGGSESGQSR